MGHNCSLYRHYCKSCQRMTRVRVRFKVFNATFNNISAILWWSVLLWSLRKPKYPEKTSDLQQVTDKMYHVSGIRTDNFIGDRHLLYIYIRLKIKPNSVRIRF